MSIDNLSPVGTNSWAVVSAPVQYVMLQCKPYETHKKMKYPHSGSLPQWLEAKLVHEALMVLDLFEL